MSRTIPVATAEYGNEVIRRIFLKSSTARTRSVTEHHTVRVGVAKGSAVTWLGEWSQSEKAIDANTRYDMTGGIDLNYRLDEEDEVVIFLDKTGSPSSLDGMSVEIKGGRVGEVGDITHDRPDGDFPGAAKILSELFTVSGNIADPATRDSIEALISALNSTGINDWSHTIPLTDAAQTAIDQYEGESSGSDTTTNSSFEDGPSAASITVSAPSGKTTHVSIYAHYTAATASGTAVAAIAIGDGTTDHNEAQVEANTRERQVCTRLDTSITGDTTFKLRFRRVSGSVTVTSTYHLITATAITI